MSMHSMTFLMIGLLIVIALLGALFTALRVYAAHEVEGDHPTRPLA